MYLATSCFRVVLYSKAAKYLKKAISFAEETGNYLSLIVSQHFLGHVRIDNCEFEKGYHHIKKALEIVEMGDVLWSIAIHKACIAYNIFYNQGKIDFAYKTSEEAVNLSKKSGDIISKAEAFTNYGVCCFGKGNIEKARNYLIKGLNFSKKANYRVYEIISYYNLGDVAFFSDDYQKAQEYYTHVLSFEDIHFLGPSAFIPFKIALAAAKTMMDDKNINLKLIKSFIVRSKIKRFDGRNRRYFSIILLNIDNKHTPEAQEFIEQAIGMNKEAGLLLEVAMDYTVYADLFKRIGDRLKYKEYLFRAIETFKKCGSDGWVKMYEKKLATLS